MSDCEVSAMEEMMCQPEHPIDLSEECDIGILQAENKNLKKVEKKYKTLKAKNLLLFLKFSALEENRDELFEFLKRVDQENWLDGDWWADIVPLIKKTEALKEKE